MKFSEIGRMDAQNEGLALQIACSLTVGNGTENNVRARMVHTPCIAPGSTQVATANAHA